MNAPAHTLSGQLIELLELYGVDTVFGIPGVHTVEMYRGLAHSKLRHVAARHEQSLGFMADGYARVTGKPGVCFVITGPGVTNILTAMAQAYADSIPMLVISGVNPFGRMGSGNGHLHELPNQQALADKVCAFSHTITDAAELPQVLARAFAVFDAARPRPVHIEIPLNLMAAPATRTMPKTPARMQAGAAAHASLVAAAHVLQSAHSPLMLVGGGALDAAPAVVALAERLDAPVVMTINARGVLTATHPLGISASPSFPAVRTLVAQSDVVLAIGTELGPTDYDSYERAPFEIHSTLLRMEIDAQHMFRNGQPDIALLGDGKASLAALLEVLDDSGVAIPANRGRPPDALSGAQRAAATRRAGNEELSEGMRADLVFLHALRDALPDALLVGDSTRLVYAGNMGFSALRERSWFNASVGFGALGYGMPAAIGAALGDPQRTVVCLAGDGGFQFTMAEMGTAMEVGAKLVVVLLNNFGYGEIKSAMQATGVSPVGVDLHTPDFVVAAQAYGWQACRFQMPPPSPGPAATDGLTELARDIGAAAHAATGPLLVELRAGT
jgi:acetolactate synthase-1/2/3 large subunit